ncbi:MULTISPECIES: SAM-dependent methyltransferase [Thermomonosporaceae]|uniref:SAM-dependent methyltransferase n=1 Tax=Thermomonosporaceae TaxID=2012 RepID=UPI00255B1BD9|nr:MULTISPECIES: SAM-dependent methyltransferase [Thermomonosporaceae]MDL4777794.1 SAM-dependent methyltransferase [Actinomadura xylanilytica]
MTDSSAPAPGIDTRRPHQARIWNHWLGGKDNYPVDRDVGDRIMRVFPEIADIARHSRALLVRVVRFLAEEQGVRQFLDVGTGMPGLDNTHEVAQRVAPGARVVYVDNDPLVVAHARALLTGLPAGSCDYLEADVRDPGDIIERAAATLDFSQPIALLLLGIIGNVPDEDDPVAIVRTLTSRLPSGSFVVVNDGTNVLGVTDDTPADATARAEALRLCADAGSVPYHARTPGFIAACLEGLELLEPGVVSTPLWRPDFPEIDEIEPLDSFGGVARKP